MKLVSILMVSALTLLPLGQGRAQELQVSPDGNRLAVPPKTKLERDLEGKPPGQVEQPAPDDEAYSTEEPDENLDDERLPPTSSPGSRRP